MARTFTAYSEPLRFSQPFKGALCRSWYLCHPDVCEICDICGYEICVICGPVICEIPAPSVTSVAWLSSQFVFVLAAFAALLAWLTRVDHRS